MSNQNINENLLEKTIDGFELTPEMEAEVRQMFLKKKLLQDCEAEILTILKKYNTMLTVDSNSPLNNIKILVVFKE